MSMECDAIVDQILHSVGDDGRYQKFLLWVFLIPLNIIIPFSPLVPVFQTSVPDHWCHVPGRPEDVSEKEWRNKTIPWVKKDDRYIRSKCKQYNLTTPESYSKEPIDCEDGWEFDHTWYDRTLSMDRKWVCDKDSFSARWLSAGVAGNVVGTLIFNILSDYYGRKPIAILVTQVYAVFSIGRLFATSEWGHLILMFLSSMTFPASLEISMIYVMEQVSGDMRAKITSVTFITWTVGMSLLPLIAWLTKNWITLGLVTSAPYIPFFIMWWLFPESARWLLSRGRIKEAAVVFRHIAKVNRKECPDDIEDKLKRAVYAENHSKESKPNFSIFELFRYPVMRKRMILLTVCYACNGLMYYAIVFNTSNLTGNEFLNFFYLAISELPGNFFAWFCAQKFGRKYSEAGFFLLATLVAGSAVFTTNDSWMRIVILVTCKALSNISFLVVYIQLAEILPTTHRSSGTGFTSLISSIIGVSSPYIAYSGSQWPLLPYIILVLIGLTGTIASLFLPETLGESLPQTISDAEELATNQPFWVYKGWNPLKSQSENSETMFNT